jgi:transposase
MRYELTDYEWASIRPMLPSKPRGVPRVNDRRVLNRFCDLVLHGGTCQKVLVRTPPATIASFAGGGRTSGGR